jgi:hypothetical protein
MLMKMCRSLLRTQGLDLGIFFQLGYCVENGQMQRKNQENIPKLVEEHKVRPFM